MSAVLFGTYPNADVLRIDGKPGIRATPRLTVGCPCCTSPVRIWYRSELPAQCRIQAWCPACRRPFAIVTHSYPAPGQPTSPPPPGVKIDSGRCIRVDRLIQPRETRQRLHPERRAAGHAFHAAEKAKALSCR